MDNIICDSDFIYQSSDKDNIKLNHIFKIENGLKVRVDKTNCDLLINNEWIKENFTLEAKRVNRWYWSVYFVGKGNNKI